MVPIRFFQGPLRDTVAPGADAQGPFFGTVPRAPVGCVANPETETGLIWPAVAPLLDVAMGRTWSEPALGRWLDSVPSRRFSAAAELRTTCSRVQDLRAIDPEHIAQVEIVRPVGPSRPQPLKTTITIGDWISGNQLHPVGEVPTARVVGVGWFPGGASALGRGQPVFERYLDGEEPARLFPQRVSFLNRHARPLRGRALVELPTITLTERDVVWSGDRLVVVALGERSTVILSEDWDFLRSTQTACLRLGYGRQSDRWHPASAAMTKGC